jgi:SAM-dependent methyltransferase
MRKAIKLLIAKAVPIYLIQQVANEVRLAIRRTLSAHSVRRKLISQKGGRVNIGCGDHPTQGWINLDVASYPGVYFWDCRSGLPFSDGAVAAIYSEHFFEHLDLESEARPFLRECLRCLQPGGVLRIVVPDAGAYLRAYSGIGSRLGGVGARMLTRLFQRQSPWETLAKMRPLDRTANGWRDLCLGAVYQTKMQFMNGIFRQGYEHKYAYDDETLILIMREAGFRNVVAQQFAISLDPKMAPDRNGHRTESLYVEAVKR